VYIRETRRRNKDGSVVSYLQLAHNERHPETGTPVAKIIHNFGRADQVDREALRRLVVSISRFLDPAEAVAAGSGLEVEVVDARRYGGAFVLDMLFCRLGIGRALRQAAEGRRLDADLVERVCFALVAQRALDAYSAPNRSAIPRHADHLIHAMPISQYAPWRSAIPGHADQLSVGPWNR